MFLIIQNKLFEINNLRQIIYMVNCIEYGMYLQYKFFLIGCQVVKTPMYKGRMEC